MSPNAGAAEMTSKLTLDAEALEITTFDIAETATVRGTVLGAGEVAEAASGSGCIQTRLTGPCCEYTRGCA
jgi:hypothetical protein